MHRASPLFARRTRLTWACCALLAAGLLSCGGPQSGEPQSGSPGGGDKERGDPRSGGPKPPQRLRAEVLETLPHDPNAFTQGFEISDGILYEGTGRIGESALSATDLDSGKQIARVELPTPLFGEGITVADSSIWQLTWKDGIAFERDPTTLEERRRVSYRGEGWGLCHQSHHDRLVMSDGSETLTFRDPARFEPSGQVTVREAGRPVDRLNELECVGDTVYANVWQSDVILGIHLPTGEVTDKIDASGLLAEAESAGADVLNGIAALPSDDEFLITGKLWPTMFRVRFVPVDHERGSSAKLEDGAGSTT